ncbi:dTDP-4-dehydrorhamnose reductase [Lacinutrix chionoecetis]
MKLKVLVTGASGQLGQCLQELAPQFELEFSFYDSASLNITSKEDIASLVKDDYDFCINCAAYTAVDNAEEDTENANLINHLGVKYLAETCLKNNIVLIHISTDFVFNGEKNRPYNEEDSANPISIYGQTKRDGEQVIEALLTKYFIIRTSWLYSQYGHNFVKIMLNLAKTKKSLGVVDDQIATPTYAMDLAKAILQIITNNNDQYGLYHYSNLGVASWYDFAKTIFDKSNTLIEVDAIPTTAYPTKARRPYYSVLDKTKFITSFNIKIPYWQESLERCLKALL